MDLDRRRPELDWIRVLAFGLLIFFHIGMFYVPPDWHWHVKSPRTSEGLEWLMDLTHPWRLSLLFLVSGAATRFLSERRGPRALARDRVARLLPPLLLAIFVIVPPQSYFQILEQTQDRPSYLQFWSKYLHAYHGWCNGNDCLIVPTWNHMWFVAYLLAYSLLLAAMLGLLPRLRETLTAAAERALSGWGLMVWPAVALIAARMLLAPRFPVTNALVGDWYNHAMSFGCFLLGFAVARSAPVWDALVRQRWIAFALFVASYFAFTDYAWIYRGDAEPADWLRWLMRGVYGIQQWTAIAAILGFGRHHLRHDNAVIRYLNRAVFSYYLVHQTLIVVAAHWLAQLHWPIVLEVVTLIAIVVAGCGLTYELARRVPGLRPWFGIGAAPFAALPRVTAPAA